MTVGEKMGRISTERMDRYKTILGTYQTIMHKHYITFHNFVLFYFYFCDQNVFVCDKCVVRTPILLEVEIRWLSPDRTAKGNFLDSCSNRAEGLPQGPLYSQVVRRQGCQVPIASVISLCKCVTPEKALICLDAYAIRPPVPLLKASSSIYIITGPIQSPTIYPHHLPG